MNPVKIKKLVRGLIKAIGENPRREGLRETPARVARSFGEIFEGYKKDPTKVVTVFNNDGYGGLIVAKEIDFYSICEHHFLPFYGRAYVGYVPNDKIIGLSKLSRLVELYSRRLQNQERLTHQVADTLNRLLRPKGVGVVIEAEHLCMQMRGVEKHACKVLTSTFIGSLNKEGKARREFFRLIGRKS